jgi:hypothetical protein
MLNATTGELIRSLSNCQQPLHPLFDGVNLWFTCRGENKLMRIPALLSYYTLTDSGIQSHPNPPLYDGSQVWVTIEKTSSLVRFNLQTGAPMREVALGKQGNNLKEPLLAGGYIWATNKIGDEWTLFRFDPNNEQNTHSTKLDGEPLALVPINDEVLWVATINSRTYSLFVISQKSLQNSGELDVKKRLSLGSLVSPPIYDDQRDIVWVAGSASVSASNNFRGTLYQLSRQGDIIAQTDTGSFVGSVLLQGDNVWAISVGNLKPEQSTLDKMGFASVFIHRRSDGQQLQEISIGAFVSKPITSDKYLWITQGMLGFFNDGPDSDSGINAIDPVTQQVVFKRALCENVAPPFYDSKSHLIWFGCINLSGDSSLGDILVMNADTLQEIHHYQGLGRSSWPAVRIRNTVWVVFQDTGNAALFDATTGDLKQVIGLGKHPSQPAYDPSGSVWIANAEDSTIQRIILASLLP